MNPSATTLRLLAQDRSADAAVFELAALRHEMKSAYVGRLPAAKETLYTVPADRVAVVRSIVLCNDWVGAVTVRLYVLRAGTSFPLVITVVASGGRYVDDTPIALGAGDAIEGDASQSGAVACLISVEVHDA